MSGLVQDAYRFILYHRAAIENSPLQAYGSALVFSPLRSMIKQLFRHERPNNIAIAAAMGDDWDAHTGACLQKLEGHDHKVNSVVFSHDSSRIASGSFDKTFKIWDAQTGACLLTLEGHYNTVNSMMFSHDSSRVASASSDKTIMIWDAQTGACLQTLEGYDDWVNSRIASGSSDEMTKIWDVQTGACLQTLSIASAVNGLSFDATGPSLHTNIGIVALRDSPTLAPTISTAVLPLESQSLPATQYSQTPEYQGYRISSDGSWITRCMKLAMAASHVPPSLFGCRTVWVSLGAWLPVRTRPDLWIRS
ncbi:hypothetical protein N7530_008797 [Penicillium desertorum]|uniref:Mitochondrial division protein 1 n=1 Tax=Penicillium desertorum TaxID=1303715 RepID=A0A9X0BL82_9EURO|nr:hypothetical protein N7530_008797 [Penicillium desertorum]